MSEVQESVQVSTDSLQTEERERETFTAHREEYSQLEQAVESSTTLLDSLASYLSTFQNDLSQVSGQISDLQQRSVDIESRLAGRKTILPSLRALIDDITLPPKCVTTIRDTSPSQRPDDWLSAIALLEEKRTAIKVRGKVRAAGDASTSLDGLVSKALSQLPPFLLQLIRPLRSSSSGLSTNLAVLQTSILLKYRPFYSFLLRESPNLAKTVERGYVNAARSYYETGMRRYVRALGQIRREGGEYDGLQFAEEDGVAILGYMADDKAFSAPIEAIFRSLLLVLVDNAAAEFTFIVRFFNSKADSLVEAERIWHEVLDPALEYVASFFKILAGSSPTAISMLVMNRLNERMLAISESRGTAPLMPILLSQKMVMWPLFQKEMDKHYATLKKLADDAEGRIFAQGVKDAAVREAATRYAKLFSCVTALSQEADDQMLFSSLTRLRGEIVRLTQNQSKKIKSTTEQHSFVSSIYDIIMHELVSGPASSTHPKLQSELSFFRTREEEARRRIQSE